MSNQELCMFPDSIPALLETDNTDKAIRVIRNGIKRIDKGAADSDREEKENERSEN